MWARAGAEAEAGGRVPVGGAGRRLSRLLRGLAIPARGGRCSVSTLQPVAGARGYVRRPVNVSVTSARRHCSLGTWRYAFQPSRFNSNVHRAIFSNQFSVIYIESRLIGMLKYAFQIFKLNISLRTVLYRATEHIKFLNSVILIFFLIAFIISMVCSIQTPEQFVGTDPYFLRREIYSPQK